MDKFTSMLARLGLRGSSDDDGRRSAQSTPRLGRSRVRNGPSSSQPVPHYGSMGSMENYRVRQRDQSWESERRVNQMNPLHRSWDVVDHSVEQAQIHGLDRLWEIERARGREMLQQSMDKRHKHSKDSKKHSKNYKKKHKNRDVMMAGEVAGPSGVRVNQKMSEARLERRVEELNKQLLEEKQQRRKDKLALARLQQEVARSKIQHTWREPIVAELERERMLRVDSEQRLRDLAIQHDACVNRIQTLQQELQRKDDVVRSLVQQKSKLDGMKQEKASLIIGYENNLQKCRSHIATLEQENKALLSEVSKLETQCGNCQICHKELSYRVPLKAPSVSGEDGEKSRVLLERLRMLEEEKSSLVLENEAQRQQYEKCLDEIANQVVQALMSQKSLREECIKLRGRVMDLEQQNRHLTHLFHTHFHNNPGLQNMLAQKTDAGNSSAGFVHSCGGEVSNPDFTRFSQASLDSLYSLCSGEQDQMEQLGKAEMSSPPLWMNSKLDSSSSPSGGASSPVAVDSSQSPRISQTSTEHPQPLLTHKCTHSPLTSDDPNSSPLTSHLLSAHPLQSISKSVGEHSFSSSGASSAFHSPAVVSSQSAEVSARNSTLQLPQLYTHGPSRTVKPEPVYSNVNPIHEDGGNVNNSSRTVEDKTSSLGVIYQTKTRMNPTEAKPSNQTKSSGHVLSQVPPTGLSHSSEATPTGAVHKQSMPSGLGPKRGTGLSQSNNATSAFSPGRELLKLSDSFHDKLSVIGSDGLQRIHNPLFTMLDSSDTESENPDMMTQSMGTSTVSLSELLDRGLEGSFVDDDFSVDNFPMSDSDEKGVMSIPCSPKVTKEPLNNELSLEKSKEEVANRRPKSLSVPGSSSKKCHDYSSSGDSDQDNITPTSVTVTIATTASSQLPSSLQSKLSIVNQLSKELNRSPLPQKKVPNTCTSYASNTATSTPSAKSKPDVLPKASNHHQDSGIHLEEERAAAQSSFRESGSSPDSAMQRSFSSASSTGSDEASTPQPAVPRDDGYSSNSTVSTSTDVTAHHTPTGGVFIDSLGHLTPTPERPSVCVDFSKMPHIHSLPRVTSPVVQTPSRSAPHSYSIRVIHADTSVSHSEVHTNKDKLSKVGHDNYDHHSNNVRHSRKTLRRSSSFPSRAVPRMSNNGATKIDRLKRSLSFADISQLLFATRTTSFHSSVSDPGKTFHKNSAKCQRSRIPQMGKSAKSAKSGGGIEKSRAETGADAETDKMRWMVWGSDEDLTLTAKEKPEQLAAWLPRWQGKKTKPSATPQPTSPSHWYHDSSLRATARWVHSQNTSSKVPQSSSTAHLSLSSLKKAQEDAEVTSDSSTPAEEFMTLTQQIEELRRSVEVLDDEGSGSSVSGELPPEEGAQNGEDFSQRTSTSTLNAEDDSDFLMNLSSSGSSSPLHEDFGSPEPHEEVDVTDPKVRAEILDELFNSSSEESADEDVFLGSPHKKELKKKTTDKIGAIRQTVKIRTPLVSQDAFYRFEQPEQQALNSFSFLNDMFGSSDSSVSEGQGKLAPGSSLLGDSPTSSAPKLPVQNKAIASLKEASRMENKSLGKKPQ